MSNFTRGQLKTKILGRIAKKYRLRLVLLFGSRVSGKTHRESDFDVAYLSEKDLDLMTESKLIVDLFPIFQSEKIDLVNLKRASPFLFYAVFRNCRVLYADNKIIFPTLYSYAIKRHLEHLPLYELEHKNVQKELAKL